ncbi:28S rRNA (cytosine-C(5))-methyltransferase isoform X2 [Anabrus simplex]
MLDVLFEKTKFLENEYHVNPWLPSVLVTELLWGKEKLPGESKPVKSVLKYETTFRKLLSSHHFQVGQIQFMGSEIGFPRSVRINSLVMTLSEAVEHFISNGWVYVQKQPKNYEEFLCSVKHLGQNEFISDFHISDMLIFAPETNLVEDELYKNGAIFLQSKASCMASFLLNPRPGSVVLDMCAAPGMKTTHLAALMEDSGILYAVEKDRQRTSTLKKMVKKSTATCVRVACKDALTTSSATLPGVEYILVDPTCSGSGAYRNLDIPPEQLNKLTKFQSMILRHALTRFPDVKRVVYSTCSINAEENEQVVENVLSTVDTFEVKNILPNAWINRGNADYLGGSNCLYAKPGVDLTTGFFMAVFERKKCGPQSSDQNNVLKESVHCRLK